MPSLFTLLLAASVASAQSPSDGDPLVVDVATARAVDPPCRMGVDRSDAAAFPARDTAQLFRAVPGMFLTNRLGRGGAWTWSWRGVDAGHGRDVEVTLGGVPLNEPGHVQGHGYLDLWFLPRILVQGIEVCPEGARADAGAFATALSARLRTGMPRPGAFVRIGGGTDGSGEALGAWRPEGFGEDTWVVAEVEGGEGVGADRGWRHVRAAGSIAGSLGSMDAGAAIYLHDGAFDVPPHLREDDLLDEDIAFRQGYRAWGGDGASRRLLLRLHASRPTRWGGFSVRPWLGLKGFKLVDNPTGFLDDAVEGDGEEIRQASMDGGVRAEVVGIVRAMRDVTRLEAGLDLRGVTHRQRGWDVDLSHERRGQTLDRRLGHVSVAAWARARVGFAGIAYLEPGIRVEETLLTWQDLRTDAVGRGDAFAWAPRAAAAVRPHPNWSLHTAYSRGIRPPDVSRIADDPTRTIESTWLDTAEGALQGDPIRALSFVVSAFGSWSPREPIVDPRTEQTLTITRTRRVGGEARITVRPVRGLRLEVDGAYVDARDRETGERLPHVPPLVGSAGLFLDALPAGPVSLTGGLRAWWADRRPLPGGFTADQVAAVDLAMSVAWRRWTFDVAIDNTFPWAWNAAEHVYASRWDTREPASPLPVRHVVAGEPFALRIGAGLRF